MVQLTRYLPVALMVETQNFFNKMLSFPLLFIPDISQFKPSFFMFLKFHTSFSSMKIFSIFAITLLAAGIGVQGAANTCNPEQGYVNEFDSDLTGLRTVCGGTTVTITSGIEHVKMSGIVFPYGNTYTWCEKSHYDTPNAKAIDSYGNQYNLISVGNSDESGSTEDYTQNSFVDVQFRKVSIYKLVGHGKAENSEIRINIGCTLHYDPINGISGTCNHYDIQTNCYEYLL